MKNKILLFSLTVFALIVSACGAAAPTPIPPSSAPVIPVSGSSTATPVVAMPAGPALLDLGQSSALGSFLVDSKGMTLYIFTNDTANTSNCSGSCADNWPPLLTNGSPTAGTGVTASMLGTITRSDGGTQVTYNGMPLYYFAGDNAVGDTNGEGLKNAWYVIDTSGQMVTNTPVAAIASSGTGSQVNIGQSSALGSFLVDSTGMTLYIYTNDTSNTSNCAGACADNWPPLLTEGAPIAGAGVTASLLSTITRSDGGTQVTYNGMPLYHFAGDSAAGDTNGEGVKNIWYVIDTAGKLVAAAPVATVSSASSYPQY